MPIKVTCNCGANFSAKDELAGKTVACPKCKAPLKIAPAAPVATAKTSPAAPQRPNPGAGNQAGGKSPSTGAPRPGTPQPTFVVDSKIAEALDDVGLTEHHGVRCPKCSTALPKNAILCVNCGFHFAEGRIIESDLAPGGDGHSRATNQLLSKAAQQIEIDNAEEKKNRTQGAPWWVIFLAFAIVLGFAIMMFMLPSDLAFKITGITMLAIAGIVDLVVGIILMCIAFGESTTCGLLYIFMPFYSLYYVFSRWEKCGPFFLILCGSALLMGAAFATLALAPMMAEKKEGEAFLTIPNRAQPRVVVVAS